MLLGDSEDAGGSRDVFWRDALRGEVEYLIAHEWAMTADDVLWRRTKQGLRLNGEEKARLAGFMAARVGGNVQ